MNVAAPFEVSPISPVMGAVVGGVDLARIDAADFAAIRAAFSCHMLLRFPRQRLTEADLITFSRRLGPLQVHVLDEYRHPRFPEIYVLSNVDRATGRTTGRHPDMGTLVWHSDLSFQRRPALATVLYGIEVPKAGGDTLFADLCAAYDALAESTKRRIAFLRGIHDLDYSRIRAGAPPMTKKQRTEAPPVDHPLVRVHPETGRRGLYISHHISRIAGLSDDESKTLLDELMAHATAPRFVYRNTWQSGDVVMWDNRCTMHRATEYDAARERRIIHRTVVLGGVPVQPRP
jgi:taurine dioxygenase